jgi:excisionase family DNA binding protein
MECDPNKPFLRASEVARILSISRAMAYQLIQRGDIRSVHIGTACRVRREDLERYIQENLSPDLSTAIFSMSTNVNPGRFALPPE